MLTPLILFLGLTVATAVIAHWSDNLGKKLGKKRVSLFGLRPRTTATILTIASSWGIMLFTLVALLAANEPLRRALFSYDRERAQAKVDRELAKTAIEAAQTNLLATQNQFKQANDQLGQTGKDLKKAQFKVKKSQIEAKKAQEEGQKRADEAQKRADEARKRADKAEKEATAAQKRVAVAQKRVGIAQKRFAAAQKREAAAKRNETTAQKLTRQARTDLQSAKTSLQSAKTDLQSAKTSLQTAKTSLQNAKTSLQNTKTSLQTTKTSLAIESESLKKATDAAFKAQGEVQQIRQEVATLAAQRNAFVANDAPIKVGQTFAARLIAANQTPEAVAAQLRAILQQGQEAFAEEEDISPRFPSGATLQLFLPPAGQDSSGQPTKIESEALLQRLAREIAASRQPTSIRLVASRNYLAVETGIEAIFVAVSVAPAFEAGDILASATIDGAQGDARIFRSLLDLTDLGRREAEKRGVNPPQSPDEPNFYAEGTNVRLFETLRLIATSQARLRVNLVTARALSTVEPLQVRFEIENGAGETTP